MARASIKHKPNKSKRLSWLVSISVVLALIFVALLTWLIIAEVSREEQSSATNSGSSDVPQTPGNLAGAPELFTEVIVDGRQNIWDLGFLPSGEIIFTERNGSISVHADGDSRQITKIDDVYNVGEGGLMGLVVDPEFSKNRYVYACFNSMQDGLDVRLARWRLNESLTDLEDRMDIITGLPSNTSGRHSGCRMAFGDDDYLWVGTGDAAQNSNPQDPKSLGGKILRVDRDGNPAETGNLGGDFDPRIYSYGHRNVQGLAMLLSPRDGIHGVSLEHGPRIDDEINVLKPGNFGWDPGPGYDESVPMTDMVKFPDAIPAIWSSGSPTQAPSGATFVYGTKWRDWSGALMAATLKDQKLKVFHLDDELKVVSEQDFFSGEFGRLRAAELGPDENLYLTTDNGENDKIIRVTPQ